MRNEIINQLNFNYQFANILVEDIPEEQMTFSPNRGIENHPAFTLGHLITATALTAKHLGGTYDISENWDKLFKRKGPGDLRIPSSNSALYPEKKILLSTLKEERDKLIILIQSVEVRLLSEKVTWRFSNYMPKNIDMLLFMCVNHEAMHLGQLSVWRRAMGLPSALAKL